MNDDIRNGRITFAPPVWKRVSESAKELVRKLLTVDPKARLSVEDAIKHPWMKAGTGAAPSSSQSSKNNKRKEPSTTSMDVAGSAEKRNKLGENGTPP